MLFTKYLLIQIFKIVKEFKLKLLVQNFDNMATYNLYDTVTSYQQRLANGDYRQAFHLHHILRLGDRPASSLAPLTVGWVTHFFSADCAICQGHFEGEDGPFFLGCGHAYHEMCIRTWFNQSQTCPQCRFYCHLGMIINPRYVRLY